MSYYNRYSNDNNSGGDNITSIFNAGILGTQRIHELMRNINFYNRNLVAYNSDSCDYNYNLIIRELRSLQKEFALSKNVEKDVGRKMYYKIKEMLRDSPIHENLKTGKPNDRIDLFEKAFDAYQEWILNIGLKYGYLTKTSEVDDEGSWSPDEEDGITEEELEREKNKTKEEE